MLRKLLNDKWGRPLNDKWGRSLNDKWGRSLIAGVLFVLLFMLSQHYDQKAREERYAKERAVYDAEIKKEAQQRRSAQVQTQSDTDIDQIEGGPDHVVQIVENNGTAPTPQTTGSSEVKDRGDAVIMQGPHKGMTVREYEKHKAYMQEKDKIWDRYKVHLKQEIEYGDMLLASSRKERHVILSAFKNFTPDQLESARKDLINKRPDAQDKINRFFDDLANHSDVKNPEELTKASQEIMLHDETLKSLRRELDIESASIHQEFKELDEKYGVSK